MKTIWDLAALAVIILTVAVNLYFIWEFITIMVMFAKEIIRNRSRK